MVDPETKGQIKTLEFQIFPSTRAPECFQASEPTIQTINGFRATERERKSSLAKFLKPERIAIAKEEREREAGGGFLPSIGTKGGNKY